MLHLLDMQILQASHKNSPHMDPRTSSELPKRNKMSQELKDKFYKEPQD